MTLTFNARAVDNVFFNFFLAQDFRDTQKPLNTLGQYLLQQRGCFRDGRPRDKISGGLQNLSKNIGRETKQIYDCRMLFRISKVALPRSGY
jgi:hypothetical protein